MIIDIVKSIKYGKYKHLALYAEAVEQRIYDYAEIIYDHLNLPEHVYIKLRPIPNALGLARYLEGEQMTVCEIHLDMRQRLREFDTTLIHELVHAEQYHERRLTYSADLNCYMWKGKPYSEKHFSYYEQPWEMEAYDKADLLAPLIFGHR